MPKQELESILVYIQKLNFMFIVLGFCVEIFYFVSLMELTLCVHELQMACKI